MWGTHGCLTSGGEDFEKPRRGGTLPSSPKHVRYREEKRSINRFWGQVGVMRPV